MGGALINLEQLKPFDRVTHKYLEAVLTATDLRLDRCNVQRYLFGGYSKLPLISIVQYRLFGPSRMPKLSHCAHAISRAITKGVGYVRGCIKESRIRKVRFYANRQLCRLLDGRTS